MSACAVFCEIYSFVFRGRRSVACPKARICLGLSRMYGHKEPKEESIKQNCQL